MAKLSSSANFKNFSFKINQVEGTDKPVIYIVEETKDDTIYTDFQEVLDMFSGIDGLSMTIKYEKGLNE